jgi:hypothetical protein
MITLLKRFSLFCLLAVSAFCQIPSNLSISAGTLTNITVSARLATVTATSSTGAYVGANIRVSGSGESALDGTYRVVSVVSATSYTFVTAAPSSVYTTAGMVIVGLPGNAGATQLVAVPASASTSCRVGQYALDTSYVYYCIATSTWMRAQIATW